MSPAWNEGDEQKGGIFMRVDDFEVKPFKRFSKDYAILTAGVEGDFNSMTIGWGGFGTIWNTSVVFLFVKPTRYTYEFIEKHNEMTISFYDSKDKMKLVGVFGSTTGKKVDKVKESGFTVKPINGGVTYEEAVETIVARKLYMQEMNPDKFPGFASGFYGEGESAPHTFIIAEVARIERKEE